MYCAERGTEIFRQAALVFHTLRHAKPRQLLWRPLGLARRLVLPARAPAPPPGLSGRLTPRIPFLRHDPWNRREELIQGTFRFLDQTESLGVPVRWQADHLPLLWQFNLHYFQYLHLLSRDEQTALCRDWARGNWPGKGAAWHPYPTSLRIVNWCKANLDDREVLQSLYRQTAYLYRNVEWHHPGNHVLENARALIFAGRFFAGHGESRRWAERGRRIYRREVPAQVLGDGGYFERSMMYHALVLEGFLDVLNILPEEEGGKGSLTGTAEGMSEFLVSVTHPDGNLALFNDSTQEIAPPPTALADYAQRLLQRRAEPRDAFAETGYFIHRGGDIYLIIDGGPLAPDFLPAHAHADIFSYELSVGGRQMIVDTGVFDYAAGEMRRYVRGTRAHNTVSIDGRDQAEMWGSFRVARRSRPNGVRFEKSGPRSQFEGCYDGYAKLLGDRLSHRREVVCNDERGEILVRDVVEGDGRHRVESRIHLHPEAQLRREGRRVEAERDGARCVLEPIEGEDFAVEESWYCPRFGSRQKNKTLILAAGLDLPAHLSYKIICSTPETITS